MFNKYLYLFLSCRCSVKFELFRFLSLFCLLLRVKSSSLFSFCLLSHQLLLWLLLFISWSVEHLSLSLCLFLILCHSCGPVLMSSLWQSPCFWQCLRVSMATSIPHLHLLLSSSECSVHSQLCCFYSDLFDSFWILSSPLQHVTSIVFDFRPVYTVITVNETRWYLWSSV